MPIVVVTSEEVTSGKPLVFAVLAPAINGSLQKGSHQIQLLVSEAIDSLVCCKSYHQNIYVVLTVNAKLGGSGDRFLIRNLSADVRQKII